MAWRSYQAAEKVRCERVLVFERFVPALNLLYLAEAHSQKWLCHKAFSAAC
jgi:hypothetical protein